MICSGHIAKQFLGSRTFFLCNPNAMHKLLIYKLNSKCSKCSSILNKFCTIYFMQENKIKLTFLKVSRGAHVRARVGGGYSWI